MPRYEHERELYQQRVDAVKLATVQHDMNQGFVLTQYFYEQLLLFEKDPASLKDTIGEMVYGMDVDQQVHRARQHAVRQGSRRRRAAAQQAAPVTGLDLAEAQLSTGDVATAGAMARKVLAQEPTPLPPRPMPPAPTSSSPASI